MAKKKRSWLNPLKIVEALGALLAVASLVVAVKKVLSKPVKAVKKKK